ncbi:MAG: hypothetical protein DWC09_07635, partial [Candidatus Poseidoniales archaeon]
RNPLTTFVANILVEQGYTAHFTETEDASTPNDLMYPLDDQEPLGYPNWLVEKYSALNEEIDAQNHSIEFSPASSRTSADDSFVFVEGQQHPVLSFISIVEGSLAFNSAPQQSESPSPMDKYSDHSVPLIEQLRHAAWNLARCMFDLHAHQSESAYAVQTRLF